MGFGCHGSDTRGITLTVESPYPRQWIVKAQLPQMHEMEHLKMVFSVRVVQGYKRGQDQATRQREEG